MKKQGPAWDVLKRQVAGNTKGDTTDIRRVWGSAKTIEQFVTDMDPDQVVLVAAQVTFEGPDFARAARSAIERIVKEHGSAELQGDVTKAGAVLDAWDGETPFKRDVWADMDFVAGMLIQNTEFAFRLNTVRSFPAVFTALFQKIGMDRMEKSRGIIVDCLGNFIYQALALRAQGAK